MKTVLIFLLTCIIDAYSLTAGYYWRDYVNKVIPRDAIKGGIDENGQPTYIGLMASKSDFVHGTIYVNDENVYAAYLSTLYKSSYGVKILCSSDKMNFYWKTNVTSDCTLVRGSYTVTYTNYYIGRTVSDGLLSTGRFSLSTPSSLFIPLKNSNTLKQVNSNNIERLVYCKTSTNACLFSGI